MNGMRQPIRIGDDAIAHLQSALGSLYQAVDMIEAFGLPDAKPLEQREHHQGRQSLGWRRRVERGAGAQRNAKRLRETRTRAFEISACNRAAERSRSRAISRPISPR